MTGKLSILFIAMAVLGLFIIPVLAEDTVTLTLPEGQYYLGDEIPLMGSSTGGTTVYLLFTGPGLPPEGAPLHNPNVSVYGGGWTTTTVLADNSFGYLWKTEGLTLSEGTYTIYAVSGPKPITNLEDTSHGSIVLPLASPPLTLSVSPAIIKPGQEIALSGVVQGTPSPGVLIWIFGEEFTSVVSAPIHGNGTYQYLIPDSTTAGMATGEYHVLVQHPMGNDIFDVIRQGDAVIGTSPVPGATLFTLQGEGSLTGEEATQALAAALDNAAIDDVYREAVFQVTPNPPNLPHAFYGNVTIDGSPAPVQTTISVQVTGGIDAVNYLVTTEEGIYGGRDEDAPKLIVQGIIENGAPVSFYVDGRRAEVSDVASGSTWQMTYPFIAGAVTDLSLRIQDEQPDSYVITASSGPGGSITPVGLIAAAPGSSVNFTIAADDGYAIQSVLVDGIESEPDGTYLFTNIAANHTISASFEAIDAGKDQYYINASSGPGGSIIPAGLVAAAPGSSVNFTIAADDGYAIQSVLVDGTESEPDGTYLFTNIAANHTISASFEAIEEQPDRYYINASAGPGGSITPAGLVTAAPGSSVNFTIAADDGYAIQSVLVDGIESEPDGTYLFTNITANHTISASFEAIEELPDRYYINASAGNGGVIAPSGQLEVVPNETITFTITASPGYTIQNIVVDGENQEVSDSFTFTNISGNHTITASFIASGGDGGTVGKGTLYVTSIPRGALITIDGVVKGQTNAIISNVAAGIHNVTLTRSGYHPETKQVNVKAGGMNSVAFTLKESGETGTGTGTLYISSIPSGAAITIDGVESGQTNRYVRNLASGIHTITLTKPGYLPGTKQVSVNTGGVEWVSFTLKKGGDVEPGTGDGTTTLTGTGTLNVKSVPKGAVITIDGVESGQTNALLSKVAAGPHNVTVSKDGYQTVTKQIDVKLGGRNSVSFTLQPFEESGIVQLSDHFPFSL